MEDFSLCKDMREGHCTQALTTCICKEVVPKFEPMSN